MGFESRAISARVTKQFVTIFSKTCDNVHYRHLENNLMHHGNTFLRSNVIPNLHLTYSKNGGNLGLESKY